MGKRFIQVLILLLISLSFLSTGKVKAQGETAILFISDRDGQPGVYVMQPDGSNVRRFIESDFEEGGVIQEATLSPDGITLAFISRKDRGDHPTNAIFLLDVTSGQIDPLSNDNSRDYDAPIWSPDGSRLVYLAHGLYGNYARIDIWDAVSEETHTLTDGLVLSNTVSDLASITGLDWSPDGQRLVVSVRTSPPTGNNILVVINADGTNPQQVTRSDVSAWQPAWRWQPDFIYFTCPLGDYSEICYLDLQTSAIDLLTTYLHDSVPGDDDGHPNWMEISTNGEFLLQFGGNEDIYLYKTQDGSVTNLTAGSNAANSNPYWIKIPANILTSTPSEAPTATNTLTPTDIPTPT